MTLAPGFGVGHRSGDFSLPGVVQVLHLGMDVSGSGMRYSPGDSIGVVAQVCDHTATVHSKFC